MDPKNNYDDDDGEVDENYDPEAEVGFDSKGVPTLPLVPLTSGEESDETLTQFRAKIYRWNDNQWKVGTDHKYEKERGAGDLKILKNKTTNRIRVLMHQDKTGKLIANHFIQPTGALCRLTPQKTTDKAWLWTCYDLSDDTPKVEKLCVRFATVEEFNRFKTEFEKAYEANKEAFAPKEEVKKSE